MKKMSIVFMLTLLFCTVPYIAYAGPLDTAQTEQEVELKPLNFTITSDIDLSKKSQSTFDSSKTISGDADKGTFVTISVANKDSEGEWGEAICYETEVGASGLFSHAVDLELGDNLIEVSASLEGCEPFSKSTIIKKKKIEIKKELENTISVPGSARTPLFLTK